jgi:hypothetical protein
LPALRRRRAAQAERHRPDPRERSAPRHVLEAAEHERPLEHFQEELDAPDRLRRGAELAAQRLFVERFGRPAGRTGAGFLRIGHSAARAVPQKTCRLRRSVRRRFDAAEHELLGADAQAVAVAELRGLANRLAVDLHAVTAVEIEEDRVVTVEHDASMVTRHERIFDRHVTIRAPAEDRSPAREIELL